MASDATQFGTIMSHENRSDAAIGYAQGITEGLINQRVNDWLNQYGHAKISFDTEGKYSGDILFPMLDNPDDLLFSQIGLRTKKAVTQQTLGSDSVITSGTGCLVSILSMMTITQDIISV
ncbi:hypothetical protein BFG07_00900 [Kosakonia cowanii]|nr:inverse autotransporter beta domain-containing protein [Kosakonia cowanii]AST67381.1 hypothetical protein BFG07_00900 [Kosakonia cowanii]